MKPPPFEYHAPTAVDEVLELLGQYGDEAKVLAGGQSLMPLLNFRLARPAHVIDINRVADVSGTTVADDTLHLGAMTRQRALERSAQVRAWCPLVSQAMPYVGHPQIRNRGTLGGSLVHADPAGELPAVALALDGRLTLRRAGAQRVVTADEFFVSHLTTVTRPDELLVQVDIPAWPPRTQSSIQEVAVRRGDFALGGVITVLAFGTHDRIEQARVVCFGVADRPIRIAQAEALLAGAQPSDGAFAAAAEAVRSAIDPPSDIHASAAYRRRLAGVLTRRALFAAAASSPWLVA